MSSQPKLKPAPANALIEHLQNAVWQKQSSDGHWHYALDDNDTLTAEFILFLKWMRWDKAESDLVKKCANHLRKSQLPSGGWPIFFGGPANISTSVEAYVALRACGVSTDEPDMQKAAKVIRDLGGITKSRTFTKIWLALSGLYSFKGVPMIPPEIMLAPFGSPFHILEFSYWSRATIVPLTILFHFQEVRSLEISIDELYQKPADKFDLRYTTAEPVDMSWIQVREGLLDQLPWESLFSTANHALNFYEDRSPVKPLRKLAVQKAEEWILSHQEKSGDWGGIQPPMINSMMALHLLGYKDSHPALQKGFQALKRFTRGISKEIPQHDSQSAESAVLQSCVSPVWDTALGALALLESGVSANDARLQKTREWLWAKRITTRGDWARKSKLKPTAKFACWSFQYFNEQFPDLDDSALVLLVLHRLGAPKEQIDLGLEWIFAMQNDDGGWGTFDRNNDQVILNRIPFADLKSLIDPSNPDVTGHILETLAELGLANDSRTQNGVAYLRRAQRDDGSWFGRWGVNALYGTCAAVVALRRLRVSSQDVAIQRAIQFLKVRQNHDGGFGEHCFSYAVNGERGRGLSTPSQTAWALMSFREVLADDASLLPIVERATAYLQTKKSEDGLSEDEFTGTGFPQHFYLRYDGYRIYWPLIALGRLSGLA